MKLSKYSGTLKKIENGNIVLISDFRQLKTHHKALNAVIEISIPVSIRKMNSARILNLIPTIYGNGYSQSISSIKMNTPLSAMLEVVSIVEFPTVKYCLSGITDI
jgi:hypothetical protein